MSVRFARLAASLVLLMLCTAGRNASAETHCEPVNLRCEYLVNPLSVDTPHPRLYWQMHDLRRGAKQTAYQVLVASRPELLRLGKADLWDTGKVASSQSVHIAYEGKSLPSRAGAWWMVRVWDMNGQPTGWTSAAHWEMGLLRPEDWKARWITRADKSIASEPESLAGIKWIWYPEGNPLQSAPAGARYFRLTFDIPTAKKVASAVLLAAADNTWEGWLNGQSVGGGGGWQSAPSNDIAGALKPGRNVLAIQASNADGPAGLLALVYVRFDDGTSLKLSTDRSWLASQSEAQGWKTAGFDAAAWKPAMEIATAGDRPWGMPAAGSGQGGPASLLRKTFALAKSVREARVYVTARGSYRFHINGHRVGEDILTPDWTDYRKRIPYQAYDVTHLLRRGDNAIGAMLGDGWYSSGLGWALQRNCFGPPPNGLLLQMHVTYTDGSTDMVVSDSSWNASESPIRRSEIYAGETYDARMQQPGWDAPGFVESGDRWSPAAELKAPDVSLTGQMSPTIHVTQEIRPKAMTSPAPGVYVFDMGQNMVGIVRLKVRGETGTAVRLRFAEILKPDGNIYRDNLRRAEATDTYTCRGGDANGGKLLEETFEPHFTYHGFRYVEVTGFPGRPTLDAITGRVFHTNVKDAAQFDCSSDMIDQLARNIDWGLRSNLESVPTDCPQRDERLGWMGDAQIFWSTACYLRDMAAFTHKWTRDVREAQSAEGAYSDVSPRVIDEADGAPAWGDAGVIVPYTAFRQYGDTRLVEENWTAMERWMNYIHEANPDLLWMKRRNNDFGDWVPANSDTDRGVIATAYWAHDARLMAEMARAIGRNEDAEKYVKLYEGIGRAFNHRFVREDGTVGNGSQTCYVLALHMGLLLPGMRSLAIKHLVDDIEKRNWHLSTGFIGTPYLMLVLTENGRSDVAYRLLLNDTYPSWGYMIKKGATTIWERWNGDTGDPGMNSFNHYAFGAVGEWLYRHLLGIQCDPLTPGFQKIVIRPEMDPRMGSAAGSYDSVWGTIGVAWKRRSGLTLDVTIPPNTTAVVWVPALSADRVTESGTPISAGPNITPLGMKDGFAMFEVGAGTYHFAAD